MKNINANFLTAGKATFTVANPQGTHYTFRITKKEDSPFFVSLLTGPDNTYSYTYLGIYNPSQGKVILTKKSKFTEQSTPVKVVRWAITNVLQEQPVPNGYSIQHSGRCGHCNRKLTVPESLDTGLGPECATQLGVPWERNVSSTDEGKEESSF